MIYTSALSRIEKTFHDKYDLSTTIRHRGERGRQRENGLLVFLRENLPIAYGVATGEIIPFSGPLASPQCDIIIYDQLRMPILGRSEAVQQVPLEAAYAVIECKSVLNKAAIKDAREKFAKIRALPRSPSKTRLKKGKRRGPLYALFGYRLKTSGLACVDLMQAHGSDDILVTALDTGSGIWLVEPRRPIFLPATAQSRNLYLTLALFYASLLTCLQDIDLGEPSFSDMLFDWKNESL
jgi:hypothetical protein